MDPEVCNVMDLKRKETSWQYCSTALYTLVIAEVFKLEALCLLISYLTKLFISFSFFFFFTTVLPLLLLLIVLFIDRAELEWLYFSLDIFIV